MNQEWALYRARKEWGDVAFARRDGASCVVGYMTQEGKLIPMGRGISWKKAFKDYALVAPVTLVL